MTEHAQGDLLTKKEIETLIVTKGLTPQTRRTILILLSAIAITCIVIEGLLLYLQTQTSDALLTIAATATGGLTGMVVPGGKDD